MRVGDSREEKFVYFGGLQSLAAAGAEHCPIGLGGAEGPDALQGCVRTSIAGIDLVGRHGGRPSHEIRVPWPVTFHDEERRLPLTLFFTT